MNSANTHFSLQDDRDPEDYDAPPPAATHTYVPTEHTMKKEPGDSFTNIETNNNTSTCRSATSGLMEHTSPFSPEPQSPVVPYDYSHTAVQTIGINI